MDNTNQKYKQEEMASFKLEISTRMINYCLRDLKPGHRRFGTNMDP